MRTLALGTSFGITTEPPFLARMRPGAICMRSKSSQGNDAGFNRLATPVSLSSTHSFTYNRAFRVIERSESVEIRVYTEVVV